MLDYNPLYLSDGYKVGHRAMLAEGTTKLYGTWIPRSLKYGPKGSDKIVSFGQQLVWRWLHNQFEKHFFNKPWSELNQFVEDMENYLGLPYDGNHFKDLHDLGYLPIEVKALPEGVETNPNIPHMTFINTVNGFAWLTLYLETIVSSAAWKPSTSATIALQYRRNVEKWVTKTDSDSSGLIPFMCHDFSARGLSPWDMVTSGLGHATSFRGSDTLAIIPAAREFYDEVDVITNSVNASEHSVSTTKIFTVGEKQMIIDWCKKFPTGILSIVADTFDLWKLITEYLTDPEVKDAVLSREGKLTIRPDSGDPVDIICGKATVLNKVEEDEFYKGVTPYYSKEDGNYYVDKGFTNNHRWEPYNVIASEEDIKPSDKGVIELLWDIFGGTINEQGYKVLNPSISAIYGDSITLDRQEAIYSRLADKGFACTNVVLGVGSFSYQMNTRDTLGFAAKGAWFECDSKGYDIYKDPITDDGTKKSLKGLQQVYLEEGEYKVKSECTWEEEDKGELKVIYSNGKFFNETTLEEIRKRIDSNV